MRLLAGTKFDREPHCERCDLPESQCQCPPAEPEAAPPGKPPGKQTARLAKERRKHGRTVSVIRGLAAEDNDLPALLKSLKSSCGAGGSLHDDVLEIQGDHLDRLRQELQTIGYKVKG